MSDYHARIMNVAVPSTAPDSSAYRLGHRDARHAAAEIASEAEGRIITLEAAVERLTARIPDPDDLRWAADQATLHAEAHPRERTNEHRDRAKRLRAALPGEEGTK